MPTATATTFEQATPAKADTRPDGRLWSRRWHYRGALRRLTIGFAIDHVDGATARHTCRCACETRWRRHCGPCWCGS